MLYRATWRLLSLDFQCTDWVLWFWEGNLDQWTWSSAQRCCKQRGELWTHSWNCRGSFFYKIQVNKLFKSHLRSRCEYLMMTTDCSGIGWHSLRRRREWRSLGPIPLKTYTYSSCLPSPADHVLMDGNFPDLNFHSISVDNQLLIVWGCGWVDSSRAKFLQHCPWEPEWEIGMCFYSSDISAYVVSMRDEGGVLQSDNRRVY